VVVHLVLGIALLVVGAAMVALRTRIAARPGARRQSGVPSTSFAVSGMILAAAGVVQVILAFG
jgi:hypothetical protein